jgi:hypothetical protein
VLHDRAQDLHPRGGTHLPETIGYAEISSRRSPGAQRSAGGRAELAFVELPGTMTSGEPAYPRRYGREFWADLTARPELRRSFDAQMNRRFPGGCGHVLRGSVEVAEGRTLLELGSASRSER